MEHQHYHHNLYNVIQNMLNEDEARAFQYAFHHASDKPQALTVERIHALIDAGADVEARSAYQFLWRTPLFLDVPDDIAQALIDRGADVNARDRHGNTPLHMTTDVDVARCLIRGGADVNATNEWGQTPLHNVRSVAMAELLLASGADPCRPNEAGLLPHHTSPIRAVEDAYKATVERQAIEQALSRSARERVQAAPSLPTTIEQRPQRRTHRM